MPKFKFSKRAYIKKVEKNRDWDDKKKEEGGGPKRLVNKDMNCRRYSDWEGRRFKGTKRVTIKNSSCSLAGECHSVCEFNQREQKEEDPFKDAIARY
jgi:TPP-dependent indolepyruvate ferredoxin oxidoreductase alpha subunit